jgi:hypothetical protein
LFSNIIDYKVSEFKTTGSDRPFSGHGPVANVALYLCGISWWWLCPVIGQTPVSQQLMKSP